MSPADTNTLTLGVLLFPWGVWLLWEIYVLIRRAKDVRVKTISMVALDKSRHLSSVVYLWGGMAAHWWWPSSSPAPVWANVVFWVLVFPLLAHDVAAWRSDIRDWEPWRRVLLSPLLVLALGFVAGKVLFPQAG